MVLSLDHVCKVQLKEWADALPDICPKHCCLYSRLSSIQTGCFLQDLWASTAPVQGLCMGLVP